MLVGLRAFIGQAVVGLVAVIGGVAWGQATAPVTTERHLRSHNEPHEKVVDGHRFHTSREGAILYLPVEDDAFTFAVFGDRTGGPNEGIDILAEAVADVNLLEPDLVMTVGDMIDGYNQTAQWLEQMRQYKSVMDRLLCPWFPVAGNHDVYWRGPDRPNGEHEASYEVHFGPLWYAFEHKDSWFIVLYTDEGDPESGQKNFRRPESQRMSPEQYEWLKETLANQTCDADHVFVFVHHPRWLGGGYGDDWAKVHELLRLAGNVSAVFGGHIHRMRYDPRDGIEYVTLASVGGHQRGYSPEAGYLHQYHMVTVRKEQVALASVPVGEVMDVRSITGEVSEAVDALARLDPVLVLRPEVDSDGFADGKMVVSVTNPVEYAIDIELTPMSRDSRWLIGPDHVHARIEPGASKLFTFSVSRAAGTVDPSLRPIELRLAADLLTETARFPVVPRVDSVPGTLVLPEPERSGVEAALCVGGDGAASVDMTAVGVADGPVTVEAWINAEAFEGRDGVVGSAGYGMWLDGGRPVFYVRLDGRWVDAELHEGLTLQPGRWYHLAGVFDGEEVRLYIDGNLLHARAASGSLRVTGSSLVIGGDTRRGGARNVFSGLIDEVRISQGARYHGDRFTPTRRHQPDDRTRLLLHMDDAVGGYLYDSSGFGSHPELFGGAAVRHAE